MAGQAVPEQTPAGNLFPSSRVFHESVGAGEAHESSIDSFPPNAGGQPVESRRYLEYGDAILIEASAI